MLRIEPHLGVEPKLANQHWLFFFLISIPYLLLCKTNPPPPPSPMHQPQIPLNVEGLPPPPSSDSSMDYFDLIPDSILLVIFNRVFDVKFLGRCSAVCRRFQSLVPFVDTLLLRVDRVLSDDGDLLSPPPPPPLPPSPASPKLHTSPFFSLFRLLFTPIQLFADLISPSRSSQPPIAAVASAHIPVTDHSPSQVLQTFKDLRFLRIELPKGELSVDNGVFLKWRADFGSSLDSCAILGASSVTRDIGGKDSSSVLHSEDDEVIPDSFYTNGDLKLRVVWTVTSLIAASARHYLLQSIISEHRSLESLVLADADGQGVLQMDREQLAEVKVKPLSASEASKRTLIPELYIKLWYSPWVELPCGLVLEGATLVAIVPAKPPKGRTDDGFDFSWASNVFEEPYLGVVKVLMQKRTYCLEMNSF